MRFGELAESAYVAEQHGLELALAAGNRHGGGGQGRCVRRGARHNDFPRPSGVPPGAHVETGAGHAEGFDAVPDRKLQHVGIEKARAQHRQSHRHKRSVGKHLFMTEITVFGGVGHHCRALQAGVKASNPACTGRPHGNVDELVAGEWQHHLQLGAAGKQGFGEQDIAATGQRAVTESGMMFVQPLGDLRCDRGLVVCREATARAGRGNHMAGVVDNRRRGERIEHVVGDLPRIADHPQLSPRGRAGGKVSAGFGGARQGSACAFGIAQHQRGFGLGGGPIVGVFIAAGVTPAERQHFTRHSFGGLRFSGQQAQAGDVDAGVVIAALPIKRFVEIRGMCEQGETLRTGGIVRAVLGDARLQCGDVGIVDALQSQSDEFGFRVRGGAGLGEVQHCAMAKAQIARMLFQPAQRGVVSEQQFAAGLELADLREPCRRVGHGRGLLGGAVHAAGARPTSISRRRTAFH